MSKKQLYQLPETREDGIFDKIKTKFGSISTEQKIIGAIVFTTLILLVGSVWLLTAQGAKERVKLSTPLMGDEIPVQSGDHVQPGASHASYNSNPPTSGPMFGEVAGAGIHDEQVVDEQGIHSLEHGAVIVWYKSDLPKDQLEQVKTAYNEANGKKILTPRKDLDALVALTSWGRLLKLQSIEGEKIKAFIETNSGRAPENGPI